MGQGVARLPAVPEDRDRAGAVQHGAPRRQGGTGANAPDTFTSTHLDQGQRGWLDGMAGGVDP